MKFYYFGGNFESNFIEKLEDHHFDGVLFTYSPLQGDFFTIIARNINPLKKIKYMVAIRPHTISPQYLCMIHNSIDSISPGRLQINLIAGHIKPNEKDFDGILGEVTDFSSRKDRSNYLIKYIEMLDKMSKNENVKMPDFYISTTNKYVFDVAKKYQNKMIIPYRDYKNGYWTDVDENGKELPGNRFTLPSKNIMIAVGPIIRENKEEIDKVNRENLSTDTEFFTYSEFDEFIQKLEQQGVEEILMHGWPEKERKNMISFIKKYRENALENTQEW